MSEWIENPKLNPPPELVMVDVRWSDYTGDVFGVAMRKDYKKPPLGKNPKQYKKGWRWCHESGEKLAEQAIEAWRVK